MIVIELAVKLDLLCTSYSDKGILDYYWKQENWEIENHILKQREYEKYFFDYLEIKAFGDKIL